tara:strand:- start:295 stop:1716 length:1422 start_codon:yes stop_codon:yes gene_type:complete
MGQKSDVAQSIVITTLWGIALSYYFVQSHASEIKKNWSTNRCDPRVIPFAGMINAPPGTDVGDYTAQNLAGCIREFGKEAAQEATAPAHYLVSGLNDTTKMLGNSVQAARHAANGIRGSMQTITDTAMTRVYNTALPIVGAGINMKSALNKTQAVAGIGMFAGQGGINMASSFVGASQEFLISMAIVMITSGTALASNPFTWPIGVPLLALGTAVIAICIAMTIVVGPAIPNSGLSHCFPGKTMLETSIGLTRIDEIEPGTLLASGSIVTSVIKASGKGIDMFDLHGVIVSGTHKVITDKGEQRRVDKFTEARYIGSCDHELLYCLNTSDGTIEIAGTVFCDWNEWTKEDCTVINGNSHSQPCNAGLSGDIPIWTERGMVNLSDVMVGDILLGGATVDAVFKHSPQPTIRHLIGNNRLNVTPCLNMINRDLGIQMVATNKRFNSNVISTHHLNTNRGGFWIHGEKIANYETTL